MTKYLVEMNDGSVRILTLLSGSIEAEVTKLSEAGDVAGFREIQDSDLPESREFRNAWADVTPESTIDICCEKARDIKLAELRAERDAKLLENDAKYMQVMKEGTSEVEVLAEREALLSCTDGLKNLDVVGKVNDDALIEEIKLLGVLS